MQSSTQSKKDPPLVTVLCLSYNHKKYIRDTLDGFVSQKTDFPVEFIVHDDASTDGTAQIVREYAEKYPHLITPILQKENLFSRKDNSIRAALLPHIRGKYVALCEGDDYWSSPHKLQRQADALEQHPQCAFCVHDTEIQGLTDINLYGTIPHAELGLSTGVIPQRRVAELVLRGYPFHTTSYFGRREIFLGLYRPDRPEFAYFFNGDEGIMRLALMSGSFYYLHETMSVYRRGVEGSYTLNALNASTEEKLRRGIRIIQGDRLFDKYSEGRFHDILSEDIRFYYYHLLVLARIAGKTQFVKEQLPDLSLSRRERNAFVRVSCSNHPLDRFFHRAFPDLLWILIPHLAHLRRLLRRRR